MGFILLTMDGMRLTRVKRFKLLCRACFRLNLDVERKFCDKCGANTLNKVSCFINEDGKVTFFDNPKRRINLRGTIYSIPKAKGGRNNKDLILREDEFMTGEKMMKLKQIEKEKEGKSMRLKTLWKGIIGLVDKVMQLVFQVCFMRMEPKEATKAKTISILKLDMVRKTRTYQNVKFDQNY